MTRYEKIKIALLTIFISGFLYCLYGYSENGKFIFHDKYQGMIINSRNGDVYLLVNKYKIEIKKFEEEKTNQKEKK